MAEISRQFHGTCMLITHQLHRVGESFDIEECYAASLEKKMFKPENVEFVKQCLSYDEAGECPDDFDLTAAIKELQYYVASRLNLGDCA